MSTGVDGNESDNSAPGAGAAYLFVRDAGSVWTQEFYVKASAVDSDDEYGSDIAVSADGTTILVGARREESSAAGVDGDDSDNSLGGAGSAYLYQ